MATTYFKYAEKEADSYVNWGEIGRNMSDMLAEQNKLRQDKRDAIDKASQELGQVLANAPQGEHKGMNQWALESGDDFSKAMLLQDNLLKTGQIDLRNYMINRQNLMDGTNSAFSLMEEYQAEYGKKMEAMKAGTSQDLEHWLMGEAEGFANFSDTKLVVNPTDYTISVGKMISDPTTGVKVLDKDPNSFATVNSLRNRIKAHFDKFDVGANVDSYVKGLGKELNVIAELKNKYQRGTVTDILDVTQRTNLPDDAKGILSTFDQAEKKMLESMMTNPYNITSILTDSVGVDPSSKNEYSFTWDSSNTDPNLILLKTDPKSGMPVPQFTDDQKKVAFDYLKTQARLMYDKTTEVTVVGANEKAQQQNWQYLAGLDKSRKQQVYQLWQDLYTGDFQKVTAATDGILGLPESKAEGLIGISRGQYTDKDGFTKYGVTLEYADPNKNRSIPFTGDDGNTKDPKNWFKSGTEIFGEPLVKDLNKYGVGTFSGTEITAESKRNYTGKPASFNSITGQLDSSSFGKKEAEAAAELQRVLGPLNITVRPSGGKVSNYVIVKLPNGVEKEIGTNAYTTSGESEFKQELMDFLDTEMKQKPDVLEMSGGAGSKYN